MSAPSAAAVREEAPSPSEPHRRLPAWWFDAALIGVLCVLAVTVLLEFRREPVYSDDLGYWNRWERLGQSTGMANHYRLAIIASAEAARVVFGESMAAYNAVGIGYGVGLIVALYLLVRLLFPWPAAFGASLLLLTSPVFLEDATLLLPDWPSMFWFVSGLALLVWAATRVEDQRRAMLAAAGAGLCIFLALSVKESTAPLLITVPIGLLLVTGARRAWRLTAVAAGTAAAFLMVELAIWWSLFGDPFRRFDVILSGHIGRRTTTALGGRVEPISAEEAAAATDALSWGDLLQRYLDRLESVSTSQWFVTLFVAAVVLALIARSRWLWFLAIPTVVGLGFVVYGVGSVRPIVPLLSMKLRYLSLGWVFLMALIAAAIWLVAHWTVSKLAGLVDASHRVVHIAAAAVLLAIVGTFSLQGLSDAAERPVFVSSGEDGLRQIARAVAEVRADDAPLGKVIADGRSLTGLQIQLRAQDKHLLDRATSDFSQAEPGDLVVVNRKRIGQNRQPGSGESLDEYVVVPPSNWRRVGDTDIQDFRIYYVEEPSAPAAEPPPLAVAGEDVTALMWGVLVGGDPGELVEERSEDGVLIELTNADRARLILGEGDHTHGPFGEGVEPLLISEPGRLGVRVEFHIEPGVELEAFRLRTYDAEGRQIGNSRMYRVAEDDRVTPPAFPTDGQPMSFADSVEVDPSREASFRVVGFLNGTGAVTVDRIAVELIPTS